MVWGYNDGQIGDGRTQNKTALEYSKYFDNEKIIDIVNNRSTYARTSDNICKQVKRYQQLGDTTTTDKYRLKMQIGISVANNGIAVWAINVLGWVTADGNTWFGENNYGNLADGIK